MEEATSSNLSKYHTGNPVVRFLIRRFLRKLVEQVSGFHPRKIVDLGCGEGIVAEVLLGALGQLKYVGYDKNPVATREAARRNPSAIFQCADILDLDPTPDFADVILCLEVIEHVEDTDRLLGHIARLRAHCLIVSVPWEPFFRMGNLCRGRYLRRVGNHPEHVHGFGPASLRPALCRHFPEVRIERSFPWLFGICQPSPSQP